MTQQLNISTSKQEYKVFPGMFKLNLTHIDDNDKYDECESDEYNDNGCNDTQRRKDFVSPIETTNHSNYEDTSNNEYLSDPDLHDDRPSKILDGSPKLCNSPENSVSINSCRDQNMESEHDDEHFDHLEGSSQQNYIRKELINDIKQDEPDTEQVATIITNDITDNHVDEPFSSSYSSDESSQNDVSLDTENSTTRPSSIKDEFELECLSHTSVSSSTEQNTNSKDSIGREEKNIRELLEVAEEYSTRLSKLFVAEAIDRVSKDICTQKSFDLLKVVPQEQINIGRTKECTDEVFTKPSKKNIYTSSMYYDDKQSTYPTLNEQVVKCRTIVENLEKLESNITCLPLNKHTEYLGSSPLGVATNSSEDQANTSPNLKLIDIRLAELQLNGLNKVCPPQVSEKNQVGNNKELASQHRPFLDSTALKSVARLRQTKPLGTFNEHSSVPRAVCHQLAAELNGWQSESLPETSASVAARAQFARQREASVDWVVGCGESKFVSSSLPTANWRRVTKEVGIQVQSCGCFMAPCDKSAFEPALPFAYVRMPLPPGCGIFDEEAWRGMSSQAALSSEQLAMSGSVAQTTPTWALRVLEWQRAGKSGAWCACCRCDECRGEQNKS